MRNEFIQSIEKHQKVFGLNLVNQKIQALADYYELVQTNNLLLHLVAPCPPEEFAIRHILESLALLDFLPEHTKFADVGTGAGLPSVPCLIVREDLRGVLIESKLKKAKFLEEVLRKCGLERRVNIINHQFEEAELPANVSVVSCRALDKFIQKLPRLLKWSKNRSLLFFGGKTLSEALEKNNVKFQERLLPMSEQRFLFIGKFAQK